MTKISTTRPTLAQAEQMVRDAGFHNADGNGYETPEHVYAFSVESVSGTNGHPSFTVHFSAITGILEVG